jgi:hypothetical protein
LFTVIKNTRDVRAVLEAAQPLQPRARAEFLQAVAAEIENQPHRGAGAVYRA